MEKMTVKEASELLEKGLVEIINNNDWKRFLNFQSTFTNYSANNVMLIYMQNSNATKVTTAKQWKLLGRSIIKGEKSLRIYAPTFKKVKDEKETDPNKKDKEVLSGFYLAPVFDISQTEGDPLPESIIKDIRGDSLKAKEVILGIESIVEIPVIYLEKMKGNSSFSSKDEEINIKMNLDSNSLAKCLVSEYTKYLLTKEKDVFTEETTEIISESVSYIVNKILGFDIADYSFGNILNWSNGDIKIVKSAGSKIQKISSRILKEIELQSKIYKTA